MIHCEGLVKIYRATGIEVFALQGLDLQVAPGEMVAIIGNSGSGKSTLLNVLGGLDAPSAGVAMVGEWDLTKLTARRRDRYRRTVAGFVWQNSALNLIPYLSALDNVLLAQSRVGLFDGAEAARLLGLVGMRERMHGFPPELSGGEQQRVAIAVALASKPQLLLADEPTGSLDAASGAMVMAALQQVNRELGMTIVLVTHDVGMTVYAGRTVRIRDGKVATESTSGSSEEVAVLDAAGRLQVPLGLLSAVGIGRRATVELRGGEIVVRPPRG
ncbi:MAG TPA: ABC transporter ATP-binding protein [Symbiobacteriaceae bacterium]